ncbi:MAG: transglutaminase domain-containing protein [Stellaceae bacterium]
MSEEDAGVYLAPAEYIDSDHPQVCAFTMAAIRGATDERAKAVALYRAVREIYYTVGDMRDLDSFRASGVIKAGRGYCVGKAAVLAAVARAAGIPARIAFADVTNHLASSWLKAAMGTDLFQWHGYAELKIEGIWLKASPTFNSSLCQKFGVAPLEFDGSRDALLQAYDSDGHKFMNYERHRGHFHDVPARFLSTEMQRLYPRMRANQGDIAGDADAA